MTGPENPSNSGRIRKGETRNKKGRPRKVKENEASAFSIVMDKRFTVMQDGVSRDMTTEEILEQRTLQAALKGNKSARKDVLKMIAKRDKARAAKGANKWPPVERLVEDDPENADAALQILGIATFNQGRETREDDREPLLLELWAVQAALSRRRGGERLGDEKISEIKRCTRDSAKLRWPRGYKE